MLILKSKMEKVEQQRLLIEIQQDLALYKYSGRLSVVARRAVAVALQIA